MRTNGDLERDPRDHGECRDPQPATPPTADPFFLPQPKPIDVGALWEPVDATAALRRAFVSGERDPYGRVDSHLAPPGHRVLAEFLEPIVVAAIGAGEGAL